MSRRPDPTQYVPRDRRNVISPKTELSAEALRYAQQRIYSPHAAKTMRLFLGIPQHQFAHFLGVTTPTVSRWETEGRTGRPIAIMAASVLSLMVFEACRKSFNLTQYLQLPVYTANPNPPPAPDPLKRKRVTAKRTTKPKAVKSSKKVAKKPGKVASTKKRPPALKKRVVALAVIEAPSVTFSPEAINASVPPPLPAEVPSA